MATDSDKEQTKVFYSVDSFPSKDVNPLPPKETCKMCSCHPQAHSVYFKCPLLGAYICISCCQEEVPDEANLDQIKSKTSCTSMEHVAKICGPCGKNKLQP